MHTIEISHGEVWRAVSNVDTCEAGIAQCAGILRSLCASGALRCMYSRVGRYEVPNDRAVDSVPFWAIKGPGRPSVDNALSFKIVKRILSAHVFAGLIFSVGSPLSDFHVWSGCGKVSQLR